MNKSNDRYAERARSVKDAVMSELPWIVAKEPEKLAVVNAWLNNVRGNPATFWHKMDNLRLCDILAMAMNNKLDFSAE